MTLSTQIKIAFFGNSEFSLAVLEELKKLGVLPEIVITTTDKARGRKMVLTPTPTKVWAENNSIEYIEQEKLKDEAFLEKIKEFNLFIVASYGKIIPQILIDIPKYKVINVHPSLLPKYRGPSPLQEQILNNEKNVGVSIMLMDKDIDHGPILAQKKVNVADWPVGFIELEKILAKEGAKLLFEILPKWIKGDVKAKEQNHNEATFTKKLEKNDGFIDLSANPYKNYLKILACEEWPRAFFEVNARDKKIKVIIKKAKWSLGKLEILEVIPEGKKKMDFGDFLRGNHFFQNC